MSPVTHSAKQGALLSYIVFNECSKKSLFLNENMVSLKSISLMLMMRVKQSQENNDSQNLKTEVLNSLKNENNSSYYSGTYYRVSDLTSLYC